MLSAEPGARIAVGFREQVSRKQMTTAALDGSIEHLLDWHDAAAGDFVYLPAGTVHAIGAGLSLIEVQQNSDITYRLYDYGRPRDLHLDEGIAVADGGPPDLTLWAKVPERGNVALVEGPHFRLDRIDGSPDEQARARYGGGPLFVIPLDAAINIAGEAISPGGCGTADELDAIRFSDGRSLIAQPF